MQFFRESEGGGVVVPANDLRRPFERRDALDALLEDARSNVENSMHNVCLRYERRRRERWEGEAI